MLMSLMPEDGLCGEPQGLPSGTVAAKEPRTLLLTRAQRREGYAASRKPKVIRIQYPKGR
jgi:hypothetical protein